MRPLPGKDLNELIAWLKTNLDGNLGSQSPFASRTI
jgi:hypothetical protein